MKKKLFIVLVLTGFVAVVANADNWKLVADPEDAAAQFARGIKYYIGEGVPQDYVQAHMWFNIAALYASDEELRDLASEGRDVAAMELTPAQIMEAQKLAREWVETHEN